MARMGSTVSEGIGKGKEQDEQVACSLWSGHVELFPHLM